MMMKREDALVAYFRGEGPFSGFGLGTALHNSYQWKVPKSATDMFDLSHGDNAGTLYDQNVKLKLALKNAWDSALVPRAKIIEWVIGKWGGIRTNSEAKLREYEDRLKLSNPPTPIQGIASFSKALAASNPARYAIYDARVAVALNAIQIKAGVVDGVVFPYLPGRNRVTGFQGKKIGFSSLPAYSMSALTSAPYGWRKIPSASAYHFYCSSLLEALRQLDGQKLYDLEMALFSQAENLAALVNPDLVVKT